MPADPWGQGTEELGSSTFQRNFPVPDEEADDGGGDGGDPSFLRVVERGKYRGEANVLLWRLPAAEIQAETRVEIVGYAMIKLIRDTNGNGRLQKPTVSTANKIRILECEYSKNKTTFNITEDNVSRNRVLL